MGTFAYHIPTLPDPPAALAPGGDPAAWVREAWERLATVLADHEPGSVALRILLVYEPDPPGDDPQRRTTIYLCGWGRTAESTELLRQTIERGPIGEICTLRPIDPPEPDLEPFGAVCEVTRRIDRVTPLIGPELNSEVPEAYLRPQPIEVGRRPSGFELDGPLSTTDARVLMECGIEPAEVGAVVDGVAEYERFLHELDRGPRPRREAERVFAAESAWNESSPIPPLREPDPRAGQMRRELRPVEEELKGPVVRFVARVWAGDAAVAQMLAGHWASGLFDGGYALSVFNPGDAHVKRAAGRGAEGPLVTLPTEDAGPCGAAAALASVFPAEAAGAALCIPAAGERTPRTIRRATDPPPADPDRSITLGHEADLGGASVPIRSPLEQLPKHLFVSGAPGSGKTLHLADILLQLNAAATDPLDCIYIEMRKTDGRRLECLREHPDSTAAVLGQNLRVYTPGNDSVSPARHNPLAPEEGLSRPELIGLVTQVFSAAFHLWGPLPALLSEALERLYAEREPAEEPPTLADLVGICREVVRDKGYESASNDIAAALVTRVEGLITGPTSGLFLSRRSTPDTRQLVEGQTLIELNALAPEAASLYVLSVLLRVVHRVGRNPRPPRPDGLPHLVIVIDEAHRLVPRQTLGGGGEEPDATEHAAQLVCEAMLELRSLGVAVIVADQHPSNVAEGVIKSAGTHRAGRQQHGPDREELAAAMGLSPAQVDQLPRLRPGEAFVRSEGFHRAVRVRSRNVGEAFGLDGAPPRDEAFFERLAAEPWFGEVTDQRLADQLLLLQERLERLRTMRGNITKRLEILRDEAEKTSEMDAGGERTKRLERIAASAERLRNTFCSAVTEFRWRWHQPLIGGDRHAGIAGQDVRAQRRWLIEREIPRIAPKASEDEMIRRIDRLVRECRINA